ncbi:MAG: hypothetical protein UR53_C0001G0029 [Candidatus Magasanikbacteria bacterium GW2011_GWC2_34_16]|uniref:Glycosyltransferase RgtA/B/C/D-like domain-containing protein n=1 Tax=Candidatus Magasanikbacteria bacterium GW2011_GWC2_34_16 TaxID=1619045 RepID=A0A0G0ARK3_9BACT|nr:MAG: hypothetical protein UR53_C0001G0029 [Candidatus Magasanikbacteria bacterium GW2011_GWC2_34_16]
MFFLLSKNNPIRSGIREIYECFSNVGSELKPRRCAMRNPLKSRMSRLTLVLVLVLAVTAFAVTQSVLHMGVSHDTVEHLHSAWLYSQGERPYFDFFQKQGPILWVMLQPVLELAEEDPGRAVMNGALFMSIFFVITLLGMYFLAKEVLPRGVDGKWALLAPTIAIASPTLVGNFMAVRPDGVMFAPLVWAMFFFTKYYRDDTKRNSLFWAGLLFGIASVILLKAVPLAFVLGLFLIAISLKRREWKGPVLAMIGFALPLTVFVFWLWQTDLLGAFYYFNVVFNAQLYTHPPQKVWMGIVELVVRDTERWLELLTIGSFAYIGYAIFRLRRRYFVPIGVVVFATLGMIVNHAMPWYNYFMPIYIGAILVAPAMVVWMVDRWKARLERLPVPILATIVVAVFSLNAHLDTATLAPRIDSQMRTLAKLSEQSECPQPPNHPIFVHDCYRVWYNRDTYLYVFRALHQEGRIPEWVDDLYRSEYAVSPPTILRPTVATLSDVDSP